MTAGLGRVLLVEDERDLREMVVTRLRGSGYEVAEADSVRTALELTRQFLPDLVLLDVGLPDGSEHELPRVDGAAVLHLRPDGYALRPVRIDEDVFRAFLFVREVFRFQEDIAKTCVSEPLLSPAGVDFLYPEEAA